MRRIYLNELDISSYQAFREQVLDNYIDMDNYAGAQCWDGVDAVYEKLGYYLITRPEGNGSAYMCWTISKDANTHPPTLTQVTRIEDLKRGDMIVFNRNVGWVGADGHIAFADEDYTDGLLSIKCLGQNQYGGTPVPSGGSAFNISEISLLGFLGAFRYDEWQQPTPPPKPTVKKRKFPWVVAWNNWYK